MMFGFKFGLLASSALTAPPTRKITFKIWGASGGGGNSGNYSGGGGFTKGDLLSVPVGTQFKIVVGSHGKQLLHGSLLNRAQQYGGGGTSGSSDWGSGGGLSGVFAGTDPVTFDSAGQSRAIMIAGGGGSNQEGQAGGAGGGSVGGNGGGPTGSAVAGTGGTQSAGGTGVNGGSQLKGGNGGGAGGGAGYWGGGSSSNTSGSENRAGAGGGSGYIGGASGFVPTNATTVAASGPTPAGGAEEGYGGGAGNGVTGYADGNHGRVAVFVDDVLHTVFTYTGADQTFTVP